MLCEFYFDKLKKLFLKNQKWSLYEIQRDKGKGYLFIVKEFTVWVSTLKDVEWKEGELLIQITETLYFEVGEIP